MYESESDTDEFPYLPTNQYQNRIAHPSQRSQIRNSDFSEGSVDSKRLRWGRSNFSPDEIRALETPLPEVPNDSANVYSHHNHQSRETPIFFANNRENAKNNNNDILSYDELQDSYKKPNNNFQKAARVVLLVLPAIFFTVAAHFINGVMTDFKLFSASLSVFQGIFWPSLVFLVIDLIWWNENDVIANSGKWKLAGFLLIHGVLSGIAMIMQLLSIQRLNISVALALSLSPEVYVILLSFINRERRFSLELIIFAILTYLGFIVVGIPAMISPSWKRAETLTIGLVASLGSMTLAVPASFALRHLRRKRVPDSLVTVSFALQGSLFSWITKIIMGSTVDLTFDPISLSWAAVLISLVVCGMVIVFIGARFRQIASSEAEDSSGLSSKANSSISQMRMLILILSCFWEILRQGVWHNFPGIYDIFGSLLVVLGYLLSVGFEAWTFMVSTEVKEKSSPFQFIPWMCARAPVGNAVSTKRNGK